VGCGRYLVTSLVNNRQLNERNWSGSVAPGVIPSWCFLIGNLNEANPKFQTTIAMSMIMRKRLDTTSSNTDEHCPESSCSGVWTKSTSQSWVTW
jgi:hypothetical protein